MSSRSQCMLRFLIISAFAFLVLSNKRVTAAEQRFSKLEGYVIVVDNADTPVAYPFRLDTVGKMIAGAVWGADTTSPISGLRIETETDQLNGIDTVKYYTGKVKKYGVTIEIKFEFANYKGYVKQLIARHIEKIPRNIIVKKQFPTINDSYKFILNVINSDKIDKNISNKSMNSLLSLIKLKREYHYYFDLTSLMSKFLTIQDGLTPYQGRVIQYIDQLPGFEDLSDRQRFSIFQEMGYVISKSKNMLLEIEPDYRHSQMASELFAQALDILVDNQRVTSRRRIPRIFQQKYDIECKYELYVECFDTIDVFVRNYPMYDRNIYKIFLQRYADELMKFTGYRDNRNLSVEGFRKFIKSEIYFHSLWVNFYCTLKSHELIESHVSKFKNLREVHELAGFIIGERNRSCSSEIASR